MVWSPPPRRRNKLTRMWRRGRWRLARPSLPPALEPVVSALPAPQPGDLVVAPFLEVADPTPRASPPPLPPPPPGPWAEPPPDVPAGTTDRLWVLAVDPWRLCALWSVSPATWDLVANGRQRPCLRLAVAGQEAVTEVEVDLRVRSWFLAAPAAGVRVVVTLGVGREAGFAPVAGPVEVEVPRDRPPPATATYRATIPFDLDRRAIPAGSLERWKRGESLDLAPWVTVESAPLALDVGQRLEAMVTALEGPEMQLELEREHTPSAPPPHLPGVPPPGPPVVSAPPPVGGSPLATASQAAPPATPPCAEGSLPSTPPPPAPPPPPPPPPWSAGLTFQPRPAPGSDGAGVSPSPSSPGPRGPLDRP